MFTGSASFRISVSLRGESMEISSSNLRTCIRFIKLRGLCCAMNVSRNMCLVKLSVMSVDQVEI